MDDKLSNFIQSNSPDGGFLQSDQWRKFQESVGRKTYVLLSDDNDGLVAYTSIIEHTLPIVGKPACIARRSIAGRYFYAPRGPIQVKSEKLKVKSRSLKLKVFIIDLVNAAKKNCAGWIRIEPSSEGELDLIKENLPKNTKIKKSAVDMQPREILVLDISKNEADILAGMKQKTRYNIRLAEKRGVKIFTSREEKYIDEFIKLVKITAERDKITSHPGGYYRKMFETIPSEILKLYVAEYEGKIITANLVLFFGKTATYMHGASDNEYRSVMAPYLLQWQAIIDAKKAGCERYDFGGVKIQPHPDPLLIKERGNPWSGITKFKTGFAAGAVPIRFPGCYDIILKSGRYYLYRALQRIKRIL